MGIGVGVVAGGGKAGWEGEGAAIRGLFTLIGLVGCLCGLRIVDLVSSELHSENSVSKTEGSGQAELTGKAASIREAAANG